MKTKHYSLLFLLTVLLSLSCSVLQNNAEVPDKNHFIYVPLVRQSTNYTCGVAALQSVLCYYNDCWREDTLSKILKANFKDGTSYLAMKKFAIAQGYKVEEDTNLTIEFLKKKIDQKKPVLVALQAWQDSVQPYKTDLIDGHYAVVIGYNKNNIFFMDPSTLGNYTFIPNDEFLERWHDTDSSNVILNHFGMIISKDTVKYNPNIFYKME